MKKNDAAVIKNSLGGFGLIIVLFCFVGVVSWVEINTLGNLTSSIYQHPLEVSNAALRANMGVVKMHRSMKDVVLADEQLPLDTAANFVAEEEKIVIQKISLIQEKILGTEGQNLANETRELFLNWKPIREEVVTLARSGDKKSAAYITKGKGASHEALLEQKMLALTSYARKKADGFIEQANKVGNRATFIISLAVAFGLLVSLVIAFFTARKIKNAFLVRDKAEEELRLHSMITTSMSEGVYLINQNDVIVYTNPKFDEMFGYEPGEMIGKHVSIVNSPTEMSPEEKARDILEVIFKEGSWQGEIQNIKKDGTSFWSYASVSTFDHTEYGKAIISVHTDITEKKRTLDTLNNIIELATDIIATADLNEGYFIFINQAFANILRLSREEILSTPILDLIHPDDRESTTIEIKRQTSGRAIYGFNNRYKRKDGSYVHIEWSGTEMQNDGIVYAIGRDISDRLQADKEKEELQSQLQQAIKMQAVGTMAGGIAHEFNNLLGVIMGCADMARDEVPVDSFARTQLDKVMKASFRVKDLVKQILTFSRQAQQKKFPVNLCSLIKESLKLIDSSIPSSVAIETNIDTTCGNSIVDPTEIQQVIMNLCSNAIWAMKENGTITVNLHQVELDTQRATDISVTEGKYIELSFSDTGQGVDDETITRIFDPFFTQKEVGEGTGMGLSIVYGIIESYGGKITVESEVGKGTTFHLYFPVTEEHTVEETEVAEEIPKGAERILFVDDEEMYAEMGCEMVGRLGYDVDLKLNSKEALEIFKSDPDKYDLVITDQIMPDLSGEELVREIRSIQPNMPIILCTGYSTQMDEEKAKSLGINAFVFKPVSRKNIAKLIRKVLDEKE